MTAPAAIVAAISAEGARQPGRLTLIDALTGRRRDVSAPGFNRAPVFSRCGRWLAIEREGDVTLAAVASLLSASPPAFTPLAPARAAGAGLHTFQFEATGSWLAISDQTGVLVLPTSAESGDGRRIALPEGIAPENLAWSESGTTLAVTGRDDGGQPVTVWLDAASREIIAQVSGVAALGVPDDQHLWMIGPRDGAPDGQAYLLRRGERPEPAYACPEGRFVLAWLPTRFELVELVLGSFAEDAGDEIDLAVATPGRGEELRPLLQGARGVHTFALAPDGWGAAFLCEDDPLGLSLLPSSGDPAARIEVLPAPGEDEEWLGVTEVACGPIRADGGPWL